LGTVSLKLKDLAGETENKIRLPSFISHPNGIVLRVLEQKRSTMDKQSALSVTKKSLCTIPLKDLADEPVKVATETDQNAAHYVKQLKRVKQHVDRQHYSYAHQWPPKQQYKSKNWNIAIILKLTLVAWDSWTHRIGY